MNCTNDNSGQHQNVNSGFGSCSIWLFFAAPPSYLCGYQPQLVAKWRVKTSAWPYRVIIRYRDRSPSGIRKPCVWRSRELVTLVESTRVAQHSSSLQCLSTAFSSHWLLLPSTDNRSFSLRSTSHNKSSIVKLAHSSVRHPLTDTLVMHTIRCFYGRTEGSLWGRLRHPDTPVYTFPQQNTQFVWLLSIARLILSSSGHMPFVFSSIHVFLHLAVGQPNNMSSSCFPNIIVSRKFHFQSQMLDSRSLDRSVIKQALRIFLEIGNPRFQFISPRRFQMAVLMVNLVTKQ